MGVLRISGRKRRLLFAAAVFVAAGLSSAYFIYGELIYRPAQKSANATSQSLPTSAPSVIKYSGQSAANGETLSDSTTATGSSSAAANTATTNSAGQVSGNPSATIAPPLPSPVQPPNSSGITGQIFLSAGCTPPRMCPEFIRGYQATVLVETPNGGAVTSFTSDSSGSFTVVLKPGTYLLVPQYYDNGKITASSQQVTVTAGTYTKVTIDYRDQM